MTKTLLILLGVAAALMVCALVAIVPAYNNMVTLDQAVKQSWSQVEVAYQRRADLVKNLVATVQGAANFEQGTLTQVTEARARATQPVINVNGTPTSEQLQQFQANQDGLSSALSRLLAVVEAYPTLTATQNFRDLQTQLEGTENRIANERRNYTLAVQDYNRTRQSFPLVLVAGLLGFQPKPYFESTPGAENAPTVNFGTAVPATTP